MTISRIVCLSVICLVLMPGVAAAVLVDFDFARQGGGNQAGLDFDQKTLYTSDSVIESTHVAETTSVIDGAVTYTLTGTTQGPSNNDFFRYFATGTGAPNFGIDRDGTMLDSKSQLDNGGGGTKERMVVSMVSTNASQTFTLESIDFDRFGTNDRVRIIFAGDSNVVYNNAQLDANDLLTLNQPFTAGQNITIEVDNGAFGLEAITINAIPEPSAFLFGGLICSIMGIGYASRSRFGRSEDNSDREEVIA